MTTDAWRPRNYLGSYTKPRRWTGVAVMCYLRGCKCEGCMYENFLTVGKCQVKGAVVESVRVFGSPCKRDDIIEVVTN